ncbi:alpha/beta fold hydrolase [Spirosoma validum]|uniref:Alpha/beta hydrolase n=1 Tax=Spirosoma validum TaxID=2771355 RepID=A0A927GGQ5_9BACT|nr:alpha/beta hydrolase [Spirosoma validum]MBD2757237.1 alpha/beta hydrolase [Spirosoma validum]
MNSFYLFISLVILCYACSKTDKPATSVTHQTRFVTVADSVALEVLDWGSTGQPLVFLTGFGNTAHVFDEFAPRFIDQYHIYAITRRGFGQSSKPKTGYDMRTLAHDILVVLDSLRIQKVLLVGHSIAGDEMSKFASSYPDRTAKLVYLDAAYDRSNIMQLLAQSPGPPNPTTKDSASMDNLSQAVHEVVGVPIPAEEIRATSIFSKEGKYIGDTTPAFVFPATLSRLDRPAYGRIQCPALAIYARHTSVRNAFPYYNRLDSASRQKAIASFPNMRKWDAEQEALFRKEVRGGRAIGIKDANHYVFISHPAETEKLVRDFLK